MNIKRLKTGRYQLRWRDKTGKQRAKNFRTLELARDGMRALHRGEVTEPSKRSSVSVADVIARWKKDRYPAMSVSSQVRFDNILRLYFEDLAKLPLSELTAARIDEWIAWMKSDPDRYKKAKHRTSFKHELEVLRAVLNHHEDQSDDEWRSPLKRRHMAATKLRNRRAAAPKDLGEADFCAFRQRLEMDYGLPVAVMATLQYYDALRVSEAVAIHWEDVRFDWADPRRSRLVFCRHAIFARSKEVEDFIEPGLKNDEVGKEHPMLPEVFAMLRRLWKAGSRGVVFQPDKADRECWSYRWVQYRYDKTFERLGLPYRSTHVMRHGGTRTTFDETGGDEGIAAQQLGNSAAVKVYAKRSVHAFTRYAAEKWDAIERSASNVHSAAVGLKTVSD